MCFSELRDVLDRVPDIALAIFGSSAWNGFHTFFLPTNEAFLKASSRILFLNKKSDHKFIVSLKLLTQFN